MNALTIGHIDSEMTWRGGQKQVIELMRGLNREGQKNILFCRPKSKIAERAQTLGIETILLPLRGEWDVLSSRMIRKDIRKYAIDIIHTHNSHAHTLSLIAVLGLKRCKLVVSRRVDFHIHNYMSRKLKYGTRVDKIIAVSNAVRRVLIEDGIDPDLIVTIKSGFSCEHLSGSQEGSDLRRDLGIPASATVIGTVASLAPHKSHTDLLKAASLVVKKHPDVMFLLAGDGELKNQLKKQISNLKLEPFVRLLGFIENVSSVFRASDIFAMTSEEEGLCTSILDAMYFGLPIVATSAGGIPEIVTDQVNGFIVPVHDYMSFADRLNLLIEQPERRNMMGQRSSDILAQHTEEQTVRQTLRVYHDLFEDNNKQET